MLWRSCLPDAGAAVGARKTAAGNRQKGVKDDSATGVTTFCIAWRGPLLAWQGAHVNYF